MNEKFHRELESGLLIRSGCVSTCPRLPSPVAEPEKVVKCMWFIERTFSGEGREGNWMEQGTGRDRVSAAHCFGLLVWELWSMNGTTDLSPPEELCQPFILHARQSCTACCPLVGGV